MWQKTASSKRKGGDCSFWKTPGFDKAERNELRMSSDGRDHCLLVDRIVDGLLA